MDIEEIRARVEKIRQAGDGCGGHDAHMLEDDLYFDFIRWIASCPDVGRITLEICAEEVLKTKKLAFERNYFD